MLAIRTFVILISLVWFGTTAANNDMDEAICDIRPDLCGGPPLKRAKVQKRKKKKAPRQTRKKTACREANQSFDVNTANLPICGQEAAMAASELEDEINSAPEPKRTRKADRAPANDSGKISFESYMQENSVHPALTARTHTQSAFQPSTYRAPSTTLNPAPPTVSGGGFGDGKTFGAPANGGATLNPPSAPAETPASGSSSSESSGGSEVAVPAGSGGAQ